MRFQYDYLAVAIKELQQAVRWREISREVFRPKVARAARTIMRKHALNSRRAFSGELLQAN